jgi:homoserine kinase
MRVVADRMGEALPRSGIQADNRVPLARGLGSSSAATVAGVVAASALLELGLDRESVFALAAEIEGHPDNAAPATFGGLTIAMPNGHVERLDPHPALRPVVLVPDVELPTAAARAALPDVVPMADAVVNIAHTALAVRAFTGDPTLLSQALHDRLHQGVRLSLVPDVQDVFDELQRAHVPVCVSGSGSTLLAFGEDITHDRFGVPASWRIWPLAVRATGYEVSDG